MYKKPYLYNSYLEASVVHEGVGGHRPMDEMQLQPPYKFKTMAEAYQKAISDTRPSWDKTLEMPYISRDLITRPTDADDRKLLPYYKALEELELMLPVGVDTWPDIWDGATGITAPGEGGDPSDWQHLEATGGFRWNVGQYFIGNVSIPTDNVTTGNITRSGRTWNIEYVLHGPTSLNAVAHTFQADGTPSGTISPPVDLTKTLKVQGYLGSVSTDYNQASKEINLATAFKFYYNAWCEGDAEEDHVFHEGTLSNLPKNTHTNEAVTIDEDKELFALGYLLDEDEHYYIRRIRVYFDGELDVWVGRYQSTNGGGASCGDTADFDGVERHLWRYVIQQVASGITKSGGWYNIDITGYDRYVSFFEMLARSGSTDIYEVQVF